jgi:hypothetical protein
MNRSAPACTHQVGIPNLLAEEFTRLLSSPFLFSGSREVRVTSAIRDRRGN